MQTGKHVNHHFEAILAKNRLARELKAALNGDGPVSLKVLEADLLAIQDYIGTGNQPSVQEILESKLSV